MADAQELVHYQNQLVEVYNQIDFSRKPNFQKCRNMVASAPPALHNKLQSQYCDLLLDSLTMGYLRYSELLKYDIRKDPCFMEYQEAVQQLSKQDPINQIYLAADDLLTGESGTINQRLAQYIPEKVQRFLEQGKVMLCGDFIYCLVLPLKEEVPGMWSYLGQLLHRPGVCKGIPEMCEALENVYYSNNNEDIADALLRVLQVNDHIYLAKELLGYTYYNMQMWNNALSYLEQYEDVKNPTGIFYLDHLYFWMAWCYGKKRNYPLEEAYYRKTLEVFPDAENALNNLGYCLFKQKKYQEAEEVFQNCLVQKRDIRYAANNLVRTYLASGQADKAKAFVIRNGVTTAMPITSTYYKKWADTYEEEEAGVHHAAKLGLRLYTSPSYQCGMNVVRPDGSMTVEFDEEAGQRGLESAVSFIKKYDGAYNGLIRGALLPERIETQTEEVLLKTKAYADELDCPIKLHAAQGAFEYQYIKEKTGKSPIEYLNSLGFLSEKVGIPHCYVLKGTKWTDDPGNDLEILEKTKTTAIYCPIIIGRGGRYLDSFKRYRDCNINIALGTDTFPPEFFQNVRVASMYSQMVEGCAEGSTYADVYRAITLGGAKMLGRDDLGRLCKGAKADMIVVNLDSFHMGALDDPIRTMFLCGSGCDVTMSIIDGKTVMKDREIAGVDLQELKAKAQEYYDGMKKGYLERDYRHLPEEELFRPSFTVR